MNDRSTAATLEPQAAPASVRRRCQVERCSLPSSSLPWLLDCAVATIELRLCHQHGALIGRAKLTFDDDEVGA